MRLKGKQTKKWRFAVDTGGTFTDVVSLDPAGNFQTLKLLSHSSIYRDASMEGIRRILGLADGEPLPRKRIGGIRFGTTIATNALLERKGGKAGLIITKGFADLLDIAYQDRPEIFKLCIKKPSPLYSVVAEVDERVDCRGKVIKEPDFASLRGRMGEFLGSGVDTVAVVFMHSWKNPAHELLCKNFLEGCGFRSIILSHETINLIKIVSRGQSAMIDAYLGTVLARYLREIEEETGDIPVEFMQSDGSLSPPSLFTGKNSLLSGPAGGVVAVAGIAKELGLSGVIGFDMGGTSTDVSRFDGEIERIYERTVAGVALQSETLNIVTVAAGGGSILNFDGRMRVGPESAGSDPGPACYGLGGPLTITDANLLTGRLIPGFFPQTFGPGGNAPLDATVVEEKFLELTGEINVALGASLTPREVAAGFIRVANERMALAIKEISVSKGVDVREYCLVSFGGAGGQHACAIASLLDIDSVIIHPLGSVMSAYGIGLAHPAWKAEKTVLKPYREETHKGLVVLFSDLEEQLRAQMTSPVSEYTIDRKIDLRPEGTETYLTLKYGDFVETERTFKKRYRRLFGFSPEAAALEVVNLRLEIREFEGFFSPYRETRGTRAKEASPSACRQIYYEEGPVEAAVFKRRALPFNFHVGGPAIIVDDDSTIVIDPGFGAKVDRTGNIVLRRYTSRKISGGGKDRARDPVLLEVFNNLFMSIATEMGITLRNSARSVNIKERLDFSCGVFNGGGDLVANAPHIPVHLGSMADSVKAVLRQNNASMKPGDMYLTNDPYRGGSHLPDLTIVCPVFSEKGDLLFFTSARGHHADVGGITPGSMPPSASHIDEEGVLVENLLLVRDGIFMEEAVREILSNHKYPARNISENIYDLHAQAAACRKGVHELVRVFGKYGMETVAEYTSYVRENAEQTIKKALQGFLRENRFHANFGDCLDDGTPVKVSVSMDGGPHPPGTLQAVIDFTGTGAQHMNDNLNAPSSVVRSAIMYVLRSLIDRDIPLNSGCLDPIEIIIPEGTLLNPIYPAPVASGNVETSQRIVDVLLGAFGVAAASQGTMNNLLFEVEGEVPYYETIAGGSGALEGCAGASGVQVHMTNTRMTDPEILEVRHPGIRVERFSLRKDSGGKGRFRGGDGVIREIRFLKPGTVTILSERRVYAPYGIKGGGAGERGLNLHKSSDGTPRVLGHRDVLHVEENDSVIIETPGGGGCGEP